MHFSVIAIVAAVAAVASAQEVNPLYPFKPNGACVNKCLVDVGNKMLPGQFTQDPTNPNFMASLALGHDRGTPKYSMYMGETGPCYAKCPVEEQDLYKSQFQAKAAWYMSKKAELAGNGTTTTTTTAGGPAPTTPGAASTLKMSGLVGAAAVMSAVILF
ncbi:hypothetical protein BG006_002738 [Podila minutissima]|uniref:Secreted protein n=1 Tax=Podila minutissima TaxID=64525 RepID=A0A9P5SS30_9FUNG|nr:hypothetical protein BG006_002738 [Podila minutissima]